VLETLQAIPSSTNGQQCKFMRLFTLFLFAPLNEWSLLHEDDDSGTSGTDVVSIPQTLRCINPMFIKAFDM